MVVFATLGLSACGYNDFQRLDEVTKAAEGKIELVADRGLNRVVRASDWQAMLGRMSAALLRGVLMRG